MHYRKLLILPLLFLLGCVNNTEEIELPTTALSYSEDIQPIFNANCTSCHGSNGGVTLTSYSALINSVGNAYGTTLIVPGDADASGLVDKIEPNPDSGGRMPDNDGLSDVEIEAIRTWINEGALDN